MVAINVGNDKVNHLIAADVVVCGAFETALIGVDEEVRIEKVGRLIVVVVDVVVYEMFETVLFVIEMGKVVGLFVESQQKDWLLFVANFVIVVLLIFAWIVELVE